MKDTFLKYLITLPSLNIRILNELCYVLTNNDGAI